MFDNYTIKEIHDEESKNIIILAKITDHIDCSLAKLALKMAYATIYKNLDSTKFLDEGGWIINFETLDEVTIYSHSFLMWRVRITGYIYTSIPDEFDNGEEFVQSLYEVFGSKGTEFEIVR